MICWTGRVITSYSIHYTKLYEVLAGSPALLRLEIVDDGCGFDPEGAAPAGRFGLQGLRERCMQMGGSLEIASSGKGTRVAVEVPIEGRKEQDS